MPTSRWIISQKRALFYLVHESFVEGNDKQSRADDGERDRGIQRPEQVYLPGNEIIYRALCSDERESKKQKAYRPFAKSVHAPDGRD